MTFKHANFDDSAVMRSLEKVAREKGWVEPKPITKSAANKLNLSPSSNLTENVLRLCAGLRQSGLEKYALDIENKFVTFKQAATLYDTHGETGDDLVNAAHPKGSHKLEDMDSSHTVLTILDQHLKGVELANKKPTGKLSNARDILRAVKIVLSQAAPVQEDLNTKIKSLMGEIRRRTIQIANLTESELSVSWSHPAENINKLSENPTIDNLKKMQEILNKQKWRLKPGIAFGISEDTWSKVSPLLNQVTELMATAISTRQAINEAESKRLLEDKSPGAAPPAAAPAPTTNPIIEKLKEAQQSLADIRGSVQYQRRSADPADLKDVDEWIKGVGEDLADFEKTYSTMSPQGAMSALNRITTDFAKVKQDWA